METYIISTLSTRFSDTSDLHDPKNYEELEYNVKLVFQFHV
jgi:hypothetical protein